MEGFAIRVVLGESDDADGGVRGGRRGTNWSSAWMAIKLMR